MEHVGLTIVRVSHRVFYIVDKDTFRIWKHDKTSLSCPPPPALDRKMYRKEKWYDDLWTS